MKEVKILDGLSLLIKKLGKEYKYQEKNVNTCEYDCE